MPRVCRSICRTLALALAMALLAGCPAQPPPGDARRPREGRAGLRLSGLTDGRSVTVSDGLPRLETADCDPNDGVDRDVCFVSRTIDGTLFVLVFENPEVLTPGSYEIAAPPCPLPRDCDDLADVALIEVQLGTGDRVPVPEGTLDVEVAEPAQRYRGSLQLRLPGGGTLTGDFDVVPRPETED